MADYKNEILMSDLTSLSAKEMIIELRKISKEHKVKLGDIILELGDASDGTIKLYAILKGN